MRRFLFVGLALIGAAACAAESASLQIAYGGWRRVTSDAQMAAGTGDFAFLLLPAGAAKGSEVKVYDSAKSRLVCCLVVKSAEVDQSKLASRYQINPVWIEDLTGDLDGATFRPHVYEAEQRGELADYVFADRTDAVGGLVVNATAQESGKLSLKLDGRIYRVQRKVEEIGSGDGTTASYELRPSSPSAKPLRLILSFRTY